MKTKAVRMYGTRDLRLEEFELPEIKEDEILVKVMSDSICMSTYKLAEQGKKHKRAPQNIDTNPVIIGHEFAGVIVEVGEKWKDQFKPGMKFTLQPALNYKGTMWSPGYSYEFFGGDATYCIIPAEVMELGCLLEYNGRAEDGLVDYEQMEEVARRERPRLIIGGASAYSREWDYARMRRLADEIGAIFMVDMAHPAGLIAAGLLDNPVKYAHIVTSTTHKTLRGPRGGVIMMGEDFPNPFGKTNNKGEVRMMSSLLDSAVFPGVQGGPLEHVIAGKAVAFGEALQPEYREYQLQVKNNAAAMAQALVDKGYKVISNGTDNHCILLDLRTKFPELTGKVAERVLVEADITANKNMVPFDSRSPFQTSGIRLGTPAITTRGAKEALMGEIVEMIDMVLANPENPAVIKSVREKVNATMDKYPMFAW